MAVLEPVAAVYIVAVNTAVDQMDQPAMAVLAAVNTEAVPELAVPD